MLLYKNLRASLLFTIKARALHEGGSTQVSFCHEYKEARLTNTLAYLSVEKVLWNRVDLFHFFRSSPWLRKRYDRHFMMHDDIQHNDFQHNDIQYNDIQHDDIQQNDIQHNDI